MDVKTCLGERSLYVNLLSKFKGISREYIFTITTILKNDIAPKESTITSIGAVFDYKFVISWEDTQLVDILFPNCK